MVKILNEKWQSTERRFEKLQEKNGNILISDYAHA
jgi:UDP-N-acetylmuramate-alanine ligase